MDNRVQGQGTVIQYTATADISSGAPVLLGDAGLVGFAVHDIANTKSGSVMIPSGMIVTHPVKGHDGTENAAISAYDKVYWDGAEAFFDVTVADTLVGYAMEGVTSGATTTIKVLITRA